MFNIQYIYELVDKISPSLNKIEKNIRTTNIEFDKAGEKLKRLSKNLSSFGKEAFVKISLPLGLLANKFIKDASNYSESINKVDVAFGDASISVKKFAETAGKNFGIDRGTALDMSALFGDMATGMGLAKDKASVLATSLVGLSGDLASFKNLNVSEVQTALSGVFTGETESLKRLGIVMTETNLQQFALSQGINKKISNLNQGEKVLLRYNYVVAMSKNSIGDFSRTQSGFANQTRILSSRFKDLSITLGTMILPYAVKLLEYAIKLITYFQSLSERTQKWILIIGGLAIVVAPIILALATLSFAIGILVSKFKYIFYIVPILIGFFKDFSPTISVLAASIWAVITSTTPLGIAFKLITFAVINFKDELMATFNWLSEKIKQAIGWFTSLSDRINNLIGGNGNKTITLKNENINNQQTKIGGQLDVNFSSVPNGTKIQMTPMKSSPMNIGVNTIFKGA
jgi:hypothetical protein